jgi:hypothetical protein
MEEFAGSMLEKTKEWTKGFEAEVEAQLAGEVSHDCALTLPSV